MKSPILPNFLSTTSKSTPSSKEFQYTMVKLVTKLIELNQNNAQPTTARTVYEPPVQHLAFNDLIEFDSMLKGDEEAAKKVIDKLRQIGGITLKYLVRNIMERMDPPSSCWVDSSTVNNILATTGICISLFYLTKILVWRRNKITLLEVCFFDALLNVKDLPMFFGATQHHVSEAKACNLFMLGTLVFIVIALVAAPPQFLTFSLTNCLRAKDGSITKQKDYNNSKDQNRSLERLEAAKSNSKENLPATYNADSRNLSMFTVVYMTIHVLASCVASVAWIRHVQSSSRVSLSYLDFDGLWFVGPFALSIACVAHAASGASQQAAATWRRFTEVNVAIIVNTFVVCWLTLTVRLVCCMRDVNVLLTPLPLLQTLVLPVYYLCTKKTLKPTEVVMTI